jgi:integrase
MNSTLSDFRADMQLQALSPRTIDARIESCERLALWLDPMLLLNVTEETLSRYQRGFARLAPASVDIYTRHIQAFYRWAKMRNLIEFDPALGLVRPKVRRGQPHPTPFDDVRAIFACTTGELRIAYVLAAFAGLRAGEVCRLERHDLDLTDPAHANLQGKGGKDRKVPLVAPVVEELYQFGLPRTGYLVTRDGLPYGPRQMSSDSHNHLRRLGIPTTLHSLRHLFATHTYRTTRDLLLLAELLGHSSVATTQIYASPDMSVAHESLKGVSAMASDLLAPRRLRSVG